MVAFGLVLQPITHPSYLVPCILTLLLVPLNHPVSLAVPSVTPSAVWYTSFKKRKTLYFVRSGDINLNNGSLRDFGFGGYLWSASAAVYGVGTWSSKMYYLGFFPSEIHPSHNMLYRWNGFPVRCLVYYVHATSE